jgi:2-dehydro-3-deoxygluconokinase
MSQSLKIRPDGALDLVSLGALVHRLDPDIIPFRKATQCRIHVSGGEFNVAANLADCFRLKTGIASAMVDYPIGDLIAERVRAMGVKPFYKMFAHNGVNGPNMATVYSDRGFGVRPPVVFYNRSNEAGALLKPGDFNWKEIFQGGVRWFHSGGIFSALSPTTSETVIEGMQAAKEAGAVVSFDLNYRAKLWNISGGEQRAAEVLGRIVRHVDVLVGNEEDLQKGLGIPGQDVAAHSKLDPSAFVKMIEVAVAKHPQIKVVATTLREVHSTNRHSWRQDLPGAGGRVGRLRPRGRRRWLRGRFLLRLADGRVARGRRETGLGAWRAAHHLPRRHHHGEPRPGEGVRQGRFFAHPEIAVEDNLR